MLSALLRTPNSWTPRETKNRTLENNPAKSYKPSQNAANRIHEPSHKC